MIACAQSEYEKLRTESEQVKHAKASAEEELRNVRGEFEYAKRAAAEAEKQQAKHEEIVSEFESRIDRMFHFSHCLDPMSACWLRRAQG